MSKPQVGFFDFSSCEGCQIELTNYGDAPFLELLNHVDIVEFREAISEKAGALDIAFIEGSFTREADRPRLEQIRQRAAVVVDSHCQAGRAYMLNTRYIRLIVHAARNAVLQRVRAADDADPAGSTAVALAGHHKRPHLPRRPGVARGRRDPSAAREPGPLPDAARPRQPRGPGEGLLPLRHR